MQSIPLVEMDSWLDKAKYAHRDYKDNAADTGKLAHSWIENFIKAAIAGHYDRMMAMLDELPEDERARNGCVASLDWMEHHRVRWVSTETKIYSEQHDYAGTMDGLAYITACGDPECCGEFNGLLKVAATFVDVLAVIDWKTSNGLYPEYDYQTAAYLKATNENLGLGIELRVIARLGKDDAEFESRFLPKSRLEDDFEIFLLCAALYRKVEERKAADKAHKDAVKARIKAEKEAAEQALRERKAAYREELREMKLKGKDLYKQLRGAKVTVIDANAKVTFWLKSTFAAIEAEYPEFVKESEQVEEVAA
jgi:DNA repair exonuclease SbcCD nuclease subunit